MFHRSPFVTGLVLFASASSSGRERPYEGDEWGRRWDGENRVGTSGMKGGTNSIPPVGYLTAAVGTVLFTSINVWTGIHDITGPATPIRPWMVVSWEYTSAAMILLLLPLLGIASMQAKALFRTSAAAAAAIHIAGWLVFTLLHVGGFVLMRDALYALMASHYDFAGIDSWFYEAPKDAASYAILVMTLTIASSRVDQTTDPAEPVREEPEVSRFTIRDGTRSAYVLPNEIVAANSEGNYVEFYLADARQLLMRTTLAEVERELAPRGIVRVHRSWLVNPGHIRETRSAGSGDRRLLMLGDLEVPASRRYVATLEQGQSGADLQDSHVA